jgi:hypothetical protein
MTANELILKLQGYKKELKNGNNYVECDFKDLEIRL